jgi:hypothetical protein
MMDIDVDEIESDASTPRPASIEDARLVRPRLA